MWFGLVRKPRTVIGHGNINKVSLFPPPNVDFRPWRRILDCIIHNIDHDLNNQLRIDLYQEILINISKLGPVFTNDYFRFVPAPPSGKFDHIYNDQELYDTFNLPQKYRDVIEAVIKERK